MDLISGKTARWAALLILTASYLAVLVVLFPASSGNAELVDDLRSGRTSVVQLDTNGSEVFVEWSTGMLSQQEGDLSVPYGNPGFAGAIDAFEQAIGREVAGSGAIVRFQSSRDRRDSSGGLTSALAATRLSFVLSRCTPTTLRSTPGCRRAGVHVT